MKWIASLILNALVLMLVATVFSGFEISGFGAAIIASVILAVLNTIVRPILVLLTLPVTFVTLGLFLFVINAITLMLTATLMGDAFNISGFGLAIIAAIVISLLNMIIQSFIKKK
ncbi:MULTISPECIES: phage holin family protein [Bacillus]|uniref:phage holin family protein n=1 Tax=Bacillus TaxID=1386 RepID=UPI000BB979F3|nr:MULTISPECIES: phage holin family protein [Bacillus]